MPRKKWQFEVMVTDLHKRAFTAGAKNGKAAEKIQRAGAETARGQIAGEERRTEARVARAARGRPAGRLN